MKNINLVLAAVWLLLALGLFLYPLLEPRREAMTIGNTGVPLAWLAVLFCVYNLLRWWLSLKR